MGCIAQVQIAMRGVTLLKVGGRMVYLTCSMNPVENEAVVSEILRRCGSSVELLDVSTELPQLACRPGLKKWKVRDRGLWLTSYGNVPEYQRGAIFPSMFPSGRSSNSGTTGFVDLKDIGQPDNTKADTEQGFEQDGNRVTPDKSIDEEISSLPLEHCMRIVHDQNSAAFFIAVFHKLSSLPLVLEGNSSQNGLENHEQPKVSEEIRDVINELEIDPSEYDINDQQPLLAETVDEVLDKQSVEGALEPESGDADEHDEMEAKVDGDKKTDHEREKGGKRRLQTQGKWKGVDPVVIFQEEAVINSIRAFYGINESFPFSGHLVTRNEDVQRVKRIYYISKLVQDVLKLNIQVGQRLEITSVWAEDL